MPDPIDTPPPQPLPQASPNHDPQTTNAAPGLDNELNDALSKHFEQAPKIEDRPKPQAEPKTAEPKAKETPPDAKSTIPEPKKKDSLTPEKLPDLPPDDDKGKKDQSAWNALKSNNKVARQMIAERDEDIKKLKETVAQKGTASTQEVEKLKKEIEELSRFRAMVDIQADPEFVSKYDQPIDKGVEGIKSLLTSLGVGKEIVDKLDVGNTGLMDQVIGHVEEHRDKIVARKLQRKVEEVVDLMEKRDETLIEHKTKYKEHLETKKKEAFSKGAEEEGRTLRHLEEITAAKDKEGAPLVQFLNKRTAPEGATQAQVDQVGNHNRLVDVMQQKVGEVLKMNTPEERAQIAVAAVASHWVQAQNKALLAENASLKAEVQKISAVSSESGKTKTPAPRKPNGQFNGDAPLDTDSALSEFFAKR